MITEDPESFYFSGAHSAAVKAEQLLAYMILQVMRLEAHSRPANVETFRSDIASVVRERLTGVPSIVHTFDGEVAGLLIEVNCYEPTTLRCYRLPRNWDRAWSSNPAF